MTYHAKYFDEIIAYREIQSDIELIAALESERRNFGVDVYGLVLGKFEWLARFQDGALIEQRPGAGFRTPISGVEV